MKGCTQGYYQGYRYRLTKFSVMYGHWYADMVPKSYRVKIRMLGVYKYVRPILPFTLHSAWLPAGVQRGCLRATSALQKLPGFTSTDDGHVYTGHLQRHEMEDEPGRVHTCDPHSRGGDCP